MKKEHFLAFAMCIGVFGAGDAAAIDLPNLKPGLWEVTTKTPGRETMVVKNCVDEQSTKELFQQSQKMMGGMCSQFDMSKSGEKYISEANCKIGPMSMLVKSTMEGNFQESYSFVTYSKMDPPMMGMGEQESTGVAKYLGDCPAGMQPGDVETEGGDRFNTKKAMENMPKDLMNSLSEAMKNMPQATQ